jgi:phage shock protein PspC (stress-responsive transcriptional regulator)
MMALKRNLQNKVIGGVCSGLADHFGIDPVVMRLIFVLGFIFWGVGPIIYLIMWLLMPEK